MRYRQYINNKSTILIITAAIFFTPLVPAFAGVDFMVAAETQVSSKELARVTKIMEQVVKVVPRLIGLQDVKLKMQVVLTDNRGLAFRYAKIDSKKTTPKAYYVHSYHTIYITVQNCKRNILAHELTHALLDEYFAQAIPVQISELIAEYVDTTITSLY